MISNGGGSDAPHGSLFVQMDPRAIRAKGEAEGRGADDGLKLGGI
jgi:hypothetical protein